MRNILTFLFFALISINTFAADYKIGVFYYPGWKNHTVSNVSPKPWSKIQSYSDRIPLLGYYAEDGAGVLEKQVQWMKSYGVDFLVMDWYWNEKLGVLKGHAIEKLKKVAKKEKFKYSIMWANHAQSPKSRSDFDKMINKIASYVSSENYYKEAGHPVIYVFSARLLDARARSFGTTGNALIARAKQRIKNYSKLEPRIYIADSAYYFGKIENAYWSNADGIFAYNYHGPADYSYDVHPRLSHSYYELIDGYSNNWAWFLKHTDKQYHVPLTSGWDSSPWGGSKDPLHDLSVSTPSSFKEHLLRAKEFMDNNPGRTNNTALICCWNEYGEGSYIEPTTKYQMKYLQQVKDVFNDK